MRLFLLLLLLALPTAAETFNCVGPCTVTITPTGAPTSCAPPQPTTTTAACPSGQTGSATTSYACVGTAWTATTVSACTATPPPPVGPYVPVPSGQQSRNQPINMAQDTAYAMLLPVPLGQFSMTQRPDSPGGVQIEIGASPTPGDFTYYKSDAACYQQFGGKQCPCGEIVNPESPGIKWGPVIDFNTRCIVKAGQTMYVNFRMLLGSGWMFFAWQ